MVDAVLYEPIYLFVVLASCLIKKNKIAFCNPYAVLYRKKTDRKTVLIFGIVLILVIGFRPITSIFGDTGNYAHSYKFLTEEIVKKDSEVIFNYGMLYCRNFGLDVSMFFLFVAIGYFGCIMKASNIISYNNAWIVFLFFLSSFSTFSYATNGIRNGLACSIIVLAMIYFSHEKKGKILGAILCLIAYYIHSSTALPIIAMLLSAYLIKDVRWTMTFWLFSIIISLVVGDTVSNIFLGLGFDDRMDSYLTSTEYAYQFSQTGFRFDFLLYSAMPILLGYYVIVKKKLYDKTFLLLINSYLICNAFWLMVIRASFSNRFAYLSWFLYPFIIAYPLVKFHIWKDQGKKIGLILMLSIGFSLFMYLKKIL